MVSNNKGISLLSSLSTSSANDEAKEAVAEAREFVAAVQSLKQHLETHPINAREVDDTVDLVIDFVFAPSFDFLSMLNFFALSDLEDDLEKMQEQIQNIQDSIQEQHDKVKKELDGIICRVRNICNTSPPELTLP